MKPEPLVVKRFEELITKAQEVEATRRHGRLGPSQFAVDNEKYHEWATSAMNLLLRVFGKESPHYDFFLTNHSKFIGWETEFLHCRGIFKAAKEDYEGGYTFKLRSLLAAEILDDVMEQASELLSSGYKDPACVLAGVALETALKDLCAREDIEHAKLDAMNTQLCKAEVYNLGRQKQITAWAHHRNKAAHGDWDEYTDEDVQDMIKGVNRFIAEYL